MVKELEELYEFTSNWEAACVENGELDSIILCRRLMSKIRTVNDKYGCSTCKWWDGADGCHYDHILGFYNYCSGRHGSLWEKKE